MNFYTKLSNHKKQYLSLGIIIVFLIFSNRLLLQNVVYESDDYKLHAIRIANYYLALKQGQFPVRWGPNLNGSFGYPAFNYMYHTPYLVGSTLHSLGLSVQESLNLTVLISLLLGSLGCYFFVGSYSKSETWKVQLSLFFIFNPYVLLNVYWRGAVGELYFYAFIPFFLLGIKKLLINSQKQNYFLLTTVSTALLIISHLPSLILLLPLTLIYIVTELGKFQLKKILPILYASILGILLGAWYWLPAYFEQWMVTYQAGGSLQQYTTQFISLLPLFDLSRTITSSEYFVSVLQIGFGSFFSILLGIYLLKYSKKYLPWLSLIGLSLFLLSNYSKKFWDMLQPLQYVQYPWRFLWVITIASIMILINFILEPKISKVWKQSAALLVLLSIFYTSKTYIAAKGTTIRSDFDWYHPTSETGSSFNEHLPIWARMPYFFPDELLYVPANTTNIHPLADLTPTIRRYDGTTIAYTINPTQEIIVLHKRLYYPGWQAWINGKPAEFVTNIPEYNGIIALNVPSAPSEVKITFTGYTKTRGFAEIVSLVTLIIVAGQYIYKKYRIRLHG